MQAERGRCQCSQKTILVLHMNRDADQSTDRQTDKQTDRQTDSWFAHVKLHEVSMTVTAGRVYT